MGRGFQAKSAGGLGKRAVLCAIAVLAGSTAAPAQEHQSQAAESQAAESQAAESQAAVPQGPRIQSPLPDAPPYVYPRSKVYTFPSEVVDQRYELLILEPEDYDAGAGKEYPVLYALDGHYNFTVVADVLGKVHYDGMVPECIVVGVTWADAPLVLRGMLRARDMAPREVPQLPGSGHADKFLQVFREEILPFIDGHYTTSGENVILGSSLGGIFATYAQLEAPELFFGSVAAAAPYADIGGGYFEERVGELAKTRALAGTRTFLTSGSLDPNVAQVQALGKQLASSHLKGSQIKTQVVAGVGHAAIDLPGFVEGLSHVFRRPRLRLRRRLLRRYAGTYVLPDAPGSPPLVIEVDGRHLRAPGLLENRDLYASSRNTFYYEGVDANLEFYRDDGGRMHVALEVQGSHLDFVRSSPPEP